jgi:ATP-dependent DNA helicase 2 subunit 1
MSVWERDNEENEEEEDDDDEFKTSTDRIIFLIDSRRPMFETNAKGESHMKNCLSVVLEVMKSKVIAQDLSTVGLTFFGTREKDQPTEQDHIYSLFKLCLPAAQQIRQIQAFIDDMNSFERMIGSQPIDKQLCPLRQALWSCSQSFGSKELRKTDFKRIWIFTNDDSPNAAYPQEQKTVVTVARDCAQAGIEISLWHLNQRGHNFDPKAFYIRLLVSSDDDEGGIDQRMLGGGYDGFDAMLASARRKTFRKRRMGQVLFSFSDHPLPGSASTPQPCMCLQIFKQLQIVKKPNHTWLAMRTNMPAKVISRLMDSQTGEFIDNEAIETYVEVQDFRLKISKEDMTKLKTFDTWPGVGSAGGVEGAEISMIPGVRLLFCMPRTSLPLELNLSTPYFLYPGDKTVKGSSTLFEAFLRDLLKKDLIAMVRFSRTATSKPQFAAILPQREKLDDDNETQLEPPGMQLLPLPCAEDLRFNPQSDNLMPPLDHETQSLVDEIVSRMTLPPDEFEYSRDINNPALKAFYATLGALALDQTEAEVIPDTMQPSPEILEAAAAPLEELRQVLGLTGDEGEGIIPTKKPAAKKRAAPKDDDDDLDAAPKPKKRAAPAAKKARKASVDSDDDAVGGGGGAMDEDDGGDLSMEEIVMMATGGKLPKLTVAELKDCCKTLKLPVSGKKDDLVQRIMAKVS